MKAPPVSEWCYRETLKPHGWLTADQVTRKRGELSRTMWETEYELQEPSAEGRAIAPAAVERMLLALQTKIEEAIRKVELIPQSERDLAHAKSQMQALERANAKEIISLQRKVELERQIRQVILTSSQAIARGTTQQELKDNIAALKTAADPKTLVVGSAEFSAISTQAGLFENAVAAVETSISGAATTLSSVVTAQLTVWKTKEQGILTQIDDKKRELEARGIRVDMAYIQKLATDEARLKQHVATLKTWKPHLAGLWKQRREVLKERWGLRSRIGMKRATFGYKANAALRTALGDLNVTLKFDENGYSPEANDIIVDAMGWRTLQVPRASALTKKLTVPKLLDCIARKDTSAIQALMTDESKCSTRGWRRVASSAMRRSVIFRRVWRGCCAGFGSARQTGAATWRSALCLQP